MIAWKVAVVAAVLAAASTTQAAERFLAQPTLATKCQAAIIAATPPFAQTKLKAIDKCVSAAFACVQTVLPNDLADVDPQQACLDRATVRCAKMTDAIAAAEQKLTDVIVKACSPLDPGDLTRADGVGFDVIADNCAALGVTVTDAASAADCIVQQEECDVEQMYGLEHPRAGEMVDLVGADLGPISCLDDNGGLGDGVGDVKLGRRVTQCEQTVTKVGGGFIASKLKNLGTCLNAVFNCVQLAPNDGGACLAKAHTTCDKTFAAVDKAALPLAPTVSKSCSVLTPDVLLADSGLDYQALVDNDVCTPYGVGGIIVDPHYTNCLYRQHECTGDDMLSYAVPRAAELLGLVGRTLPGHFFCIPPEGF